MSALVAGGSFVHLLMVVHRQSRPYGYCPRCNSKARHRRDWLFLKEIMNLFSEELHLLDVVRQNMHSRDNW
jgi:hypothetical protein